MTDYPIDDAKREAHRLIELSKTAVEIVRDLAACDPVVHVPTDHGSDSAYECGVCQVVIENNAAYEYAEEMRRHRRAKFPHTDTCAWRRARELTT